MVEYQWGVFWADLSPSKGSEQAGMRPVLVISAEEVNQTLPIITVISLTSYKPGRKIYPVEVFMKASETGLPKDSIAMAHQLRVISKERLAGKCASVISEEVKEKIKSAIRIYLDI